MFVPRVIGQSVLNENKQQLLALQIQHSISLESDSSRKCIRYKINKKDIVLRIWKTQKQKFSSVYKQIEYRIRFLVISDKKYKK